MTQRVRWSINEFGVAEVRLSRPDKMNALDTAMVDALLATLDALEQSADLTAVVVYGEGKAFCAGLDMARFAQMAQAGSDSDLKDLLTRTHGPCNAVQKITYGWRQLPVPVIAAVHGVAVGGGLQIALGADIRVVHPETKLSVLEVQWGLVPDMGGMVFLNQLAATDVVRELVFTGRFFSGEEALALGLATRVSTDPVTEAQALAAAIAQRNPETIRRNKALINMACAGIDEASLLLAESQHQQALIASPGQVEAVQKALAAKIAKNTPSTKA